MLAPNQPRESMWLHKKFYPPSYPRENPILGPGLNKDALTSRCVVDSASIVRRGLQGPKIGQAFAYTEISSQAFPYS